jgi:hypothetical protein
VLCSHTQMNVPAAIATPHSPCIKPLPCGFRGGGRNDPRATKDELYYKQEFFYQEKLAFGV